MYEAYQNALGMRTLAAFNNIDRIPLANTIEDNATNNGEDFQTSLINPLESSKSFIALGSYDGKVRILTMYTWILAFELPLVHPKEMNSGMYQEGFKTKVEISAHEFMGLGKSLRENNNIFADGNTAFDDASTTAGSSHPKATVFSSTNEMLSNKGSSVYVEKMIKMLPKVSVDPRSTAKSSNSLPAMGVNWLGWSADGKYLAATEESQARCLWIWEPSIARLVELFIQIEAITCASWRPFVPLPPEALPRPRENFLAFCTGTSTLYLWSDIRGLLKYDEVISEQDRNTFHIHHLKWNKDGTAILLKGKDTSAICKFSLKEI
jgi:hypothetical protein